VRKFASERFVMEFPPHDGGAAARIPWRISPSQNQGRRVPLRRGSPPRLSIPAMPERGPRRGGLAARRGQRWRGLRKRGGNVSSALGNAAAGRGAAGNDASPLPLLGSLHTRWSLARGDTVRARGCPSPRPWAPLRSVDGVGPAAPAKPLRHRPSRSLIRGWRLGEGPRPPSPPAGQPASPRSPWPGARWRAQERAAGFLPSGRPLPRRGWKEGWLPGSTKPGVGASARFLPRPRRLPPLFSLRAGASARHVAGDQARSLPGLTLDGSSKGGRTGSARGWDRLLGGCRVSQGGLGAAAAMNRRAAPSPLSSSPGSGYYAAESHTNEVYVEDPPPEPALDYHRGTGTRAHPWDPRGEAVVGPGAALTSPVPQCRSGVPRSASTAGKPPATRPGGAPTAAAWGRAAS